MCGITRHFTCIVCPNGCEMEARLENGQIIEIQGASCPRGESYARQEILDPRRTIASSVLVRNGALPLVSVRLNQPVPKNRIFDVMREISKQELDAPVACGTCVISNVLGLGSDVIVTKSVPIAAGNHSRQNK